MKRALAILLVLVAMISAVFAMGGKESGSVNESGYKDTIKIAIGADVTSFDPHIGKETPAVAVTNHIYDTLVRVDPVTDEVVPQIAESWEIVSATEYRFHIRQGIKFHNGEDLTADDVKLAEFTLDVVGPECYWKSKDNDFAFENLVQTLDLSEGWNLAIEYSGGLKGTIWKNGEPTKGVALDKDNNELPIADQNAIASTATDDAFDLFKLNQHHGQQQHPAQQASSRKLLPKQQRQQQSQCHDQRQSHRQRSSYRLRRRCRPARWKREKSSI